ncbi:MAG: hypothetical protein NT150_13530 [Bacteroidetes bacterium]|nr:hypothetical protein [Bacteroidota bacterium]
MNNQFDILRLKLDEFIKKYYKNQLLKGALYAAIIVLSFFLFTVVAEHFGRFETGVRTFLFYSLLGVSLFVFAKFFVLPLSKLYKWSKTISYEQAAKMLSGHFKQIQDKLINALQLQNISQQQNELLLASINQKVEELSPLPFSSAVDFRENIKYARYLAFIFLFFILGWMVFPQVVRDSANRILHHQTYFAAPLPYHFNIVNKELKVAQNEDFQLNIIVEGSVIPEEVYVEMAGSTIKLQKADKIHFSYLFKNVNQNTEFILKTDEVTSEKHTLLALPKALVTEMEILLNYPPYLHKPAETIKNTGDLAIPEGTKVSWNFNTKNTDAVALTFADSVYRLKQEDDVFSFSKKIVETQQYVMKASNKMLDNSESTSYFINVQKDAYPEIKVENVEDTLELNKIFSVGFIADDYGLSRLTFNYHKIEVDGSAPKSFQVKEIKINSVLQEQEFNHFTNLKALDLKPGESIEYYFEVWDNDGVNGRKSAKSALSSFQMPSVSDVEESVQSKQNDMIDKLQSAAKEADQLQKEYEEIKNELLNKKDLEWSDKKKLKEFLKKQDAFSEKVDQLKEENKNINEQKDAFFEQSEELMKKQEQLQKLMDQLLPEEMKEQFEELKKLMDEMSKEKTEELLEKINMNNKEAEKELDRTLEIFKQIEFEEKLESTINQLDKLSQEQKKLSEETKDADKKKQEELMKKQEELNKEFENVKKDIEDLKDKNSKLEYPKLFNDPQEKKNEVQDEMKKAGDNLQQNKNKPASENQKNASEKMQEMSKELSAMKEKEEKQQQAEDMNAMRQILENLLYLSFEQEKLMNSFKKTYPQDPKYVQLTKEQHKLKNDAKIIEDSLLALSKRQVLLQSIVNKEIGMINQNLQEAVALLAERRTSEANEKQHYVMTSSNNLALMLDESLQQMQQQMAQKMFGSKKCDKPGNGPPSISTLKKMQQQMSKQMQDMKDGKDKGGKSGKDGEKGESGEKKNLAKLAAQQAAIRQHLQQLNQQLNKDGKGGAGGNGDLDKIGEMMRKTEAEIVNDKVTQETIMRQKEILTRMLEAEKAIKEREFDKERESKEGKESEKGNLKYFKEYKWIKKKESELLKTVPPSLNNFYKKKVNEYFNTLNE